MFKFELGLQVKDTVTGFVGIITARAEYSTGKILYLTEAIDSTGRPIEWWFEESRLELCYGE